MCSQGHDFLLFGCIKLPRELGCSWGHPSFRFAFTVFTWATAGMEISKKRSETYGLSPAVPLCPVPSLHHTAKESLGATDLPLRTARPTWVLRGRKPACCHQLESCTGGAAPSAAPAVRHTTAAFGEGDTTSQRTACVGLQIKSWGNRNCPNEESILSAALQPGTQLAFTQTVSGAW